MAETYENPGPNREEIDATKGPLVLEFGTAWCGYCRGADKLILPAVASHPDVKHLRVEDGPGRRLGRSFRIKLWPTLVFLADGHEVARVVRPEDAEALKSAFDSLTRSNPYSRKQDTCQPGVSNRFRA